MSSTIIPPEIPPADPATYQFTDPDTGSPLHNPSHAQLHTKINTAVENLNTRVAVTEASVNSIWPEVNQARMVAHAWLVPGTLDEANNGKLLMPPLWNLTGRSVLFYAATASVFTAPLGRSIEVELWTGSEITGELLDADSASMILKTPLVIPAGQFTSNTATMISSGFADQAHQAVNDWVAAVVTQVGTTNPGADLTVQLNRLL